MRPIFRAASPVFVQLTVELPSVSEWRFEGRGRHIPLNVVKDCPIEILENCREEHEAYINCYERTCDTVKIFATCKKETFVMVQIL